MSGTGPGTGSSEAGKTISCAAAGARPAATIMTAQASFMLLNMTSLPIKCRRLEWRLAMSVVDDADAAGERLRHHELAVGDFQWQPGERPRCRSVDHRAGFARIV